jgi:microsomal dipeptidase-like Zn-dependent dipeptidase
MASKPIRFSIDVLGADRVVVGSDWPVQRDLDVSRERLTAALAGLDLTASELALISSENARRMLAAASPRQCAARSPAGATAGQEAAWDWAQARGYL